MFAIVFVKKSQNRYYEKPEIININFVLDCFAGCTDQFVWQQQDPALPDPVAGRNHFFTSFFWDSGYPPFLSRSRISKTAGQMALFFSIRGMTWYTRRWSVWGYSRHAFGLTS